MGKKHHKRRPQHVPENAVPLYTFKPTITLPLFMDDTNIMLVYIKPCIYVCELDMSILIPIGIMFFPNRNISVDEFNHLLANMEETGIDASQLNNVPEPLFHLLLNWVMERRK